MNQYCVWFQIQLRDRSERLQHKLDQLQGNFGNVAGAKADLSQQLLMTEEEKLKISKTLVEMQIENNNIREEMEAAKFELTNKVCWEEILVVKGQMHHHLGKDRLPCYCYLLSTIDSQLDAKNIVHIGIHEGPVMAASGLLHGHFCKP